MEQEYQVIARRWRPQSFTDLVGQDHIVQTLENAIKLNQIAHAFLFIGPRGTGKTSTARLLAAALNNPNMPSIQIDHTNNIIQEIFNGNCIDVIEIDGASNNSVEQIRALREECQYAPTVCRFKIYIIDEVHMLSQSAFNALLKTLEEPPSHVKFIFATTECHKIPLTITSRCQRFEFQPISNEIIVKKLQQIITTDQMEAEDIALETIARLAQGGMRDAQSILEQMISFGNAKITEQDVVNAYNLATRTEIQSIVDVIFNREYNKIANIAEKFSHKNLSYLFHDIEQYLSNKLHNTHDSKLSAILLNIMQIFTDTHYLIKDIYDTQIALQITLFKAIEAFNLRKIDDIIDLIKKKN